MLFFIKLITIYFYNDLDQQILFFAINLSN